MFNKVPMQERRREGSIDCESEKVAGIQPSQQRRHSSCICAGIRDVFSRLQCDYSSVHKGVLFNLFKWRITATS